MFRGDARESTDRLIAEGRLAGKVVAIRDDDSSRSVARGRGLVQIGRWRVEGARRRLRRTFGRTV